MKSIKIMILTRIIPGIVIAAAALSGTGTMAQTEPTAVRPAATDSVTIARRLDDLKTKRERLQKEIKEQDRKRDRQIAGVAPERLEEMNDRQDSLCLALRSELTEVILEIREISPEAHAPFLIQQYNTLVGRKSKPAINRGQDSDNSNNSNNYNNSNRKQ